MHRPLITALLPLLLLPSQARADKTMQALQKLEGYAIIAVTQVDGEFKGCEYDRVIKFRNGTSLKCSTYSYSYSYAPEAVIFAKSFEFQGKSFAQIRLLVEGEVYDMGVQLLK